MPVSASPVPALPGAVGRTGRSLNVSSPMTFENRDFRPTRGCPRARHVFLAGGRDLLPHDGMPGRGPFSVRGDVVVRREKGGRPDLSRTRISCPRLPMVFGSGCSRRGKTRWRNVLHEGVRNSGIRRCTGVKGRAFRVRMLRRECSAGKSTQGPVGGMPVPGPVWRRRPGEPVCLSTC